MICRRTTERVREAGGGGGGGGGKREGQKKFTWQGRAVGQVWRRKEGKPPPSRLPLNTPSKREEGRKKEKRQLPPFLSGSVQVPCEVFDQ